MDGLVDRAAAIYLSDSDIYAICGQDVQIIAYADIAEYTNIFDLFRESAGVIIFYAVGDERTGHFTSLIWHPDRNEIEHFDSLGMSLEANLKSAIYDSKLSGGRNYVRELINKAISSNGVKFVENRVKFQKNKSDINTCGRYCAVRCRLKGLSMAQFQALLTKQKLQPDMIVSYLTVLYTENTDELLNLALV